jgi:hypothetical protein
MDGYVMIGWKCTSLNNFGIVVGMLVKYGLQGFYGNYGQFLQRIVNGV